MKLAMFFPLFPRKMCLTVRHKKRQNPHSWLVRIEGITIYQRQINRRRQAGRSVGYGYRASLHSYGGTFDSVTCHQRRYHYARLRIMAGSRAIGCIQRWCCSLCRRPFHLPDNRRSRRTRCLASRKQNVSACPIHLSKCVSRWDTFWSLSAHRNTPSIRCASVNGEYVLFILRS